MNILKILAKIIAVPLLSLISFAGYSLPHASSPTLGGFYPTGGGTYHLQSPVGTTDVTVPLASFKEPVSNISYTMSYLNSSVEYGTIDPQNSSSEYISFTGITQNVDGTATLTGVTRGLGRSYPYTASSTLRVAHQANSQFIISNTPSFYQEFATKQNNETISGSWTFSATTTMATSTIASSTISNATITSGSAAFTLPSSFSGTISVPYNGASSSAASVGYVTDAALGHLTSFTFVNSTSTNATSTNQFTTNLVGTSATTTNFFTKNASTTNSTTTNAYITNLVASSCTGCGSGSVYGGTMSDGSDGVGTISANATATRDMYYTTLTVNSGVTYNTAGYKIFAQTSITNNGTITNSGGDGIAGSSGTHGNGGTAAGSGSVPGGRVGGNGNDRGANNGVAGISSSYDLVDQSCAAGGGGGNGSVSNGGSGGTAGSNTVSVQTPRSSFGAFNLTGFTTAGASTTVFAFNTNCGAGGGGGGGIGNGSVGGGAGGGGGGSGGVTWLAAPTITNNVTGVIKSNGGNGGAGETSLSTGASGGGGGGAGNGGVVFLLYSTLTNTGSITVNAGSVGAAGTGQMSNGNPGGSGASGLVIQIKNN